MNTEKLLDLRNDGLNMAADGRHLYIRCMRTMYKYTLDDMRCRAQNTVFRKDGKARGFSVCDTFVFLTDFCDLYILDKDDLRVIEVKRIGQDLSSDIGAVRFDAQNAYIAIRNGKLAVVDLNTLAVRVATIGTASSWDFCVVGDRLYTGTTSGDIIVTDANNMQCICINRVCKKNIYSVVHDQGLLYIVSQDASIKAVNARTLEVVREAKRAVKGMVRILGLCGDDVVVADGGISLWNKCTLELHERFNFPTGHFNKGVVLCGNALFGSDYESVYRCIL